MRTGILTGPEQVANRLRDELRHGRWSGTLPGIYRLSAELGFSRKPVEQALLMLEDEGLLVPQGVGRRRKIVRPAKIAIRPLRSFAATHLPFKHQNTRCVEVCNLGETHAFDHTDY